MKIKKFAFIVDGVVKCRLSFPDNTPDAEMKTIGLKSNPLIIETTNLEEKPQVGWTWDGDQFNPPAE